MSCSIFFQRVWAMPNKNTFSIPPIRSLIEQEVGDGVWLDPFSCGTRVGTITNDLNPAVDADYHMDALDFLMMFDDASVDGVLYDPPYSPRQVSECYHNIGKEITMETTQSSFWALQKAEIG